MAHRRRAFVVHTDSDSRVGPVVMITTPRARRRRRARGVLGIGRTEVGQAECRGPGLALADRSALGVAILEPDFDHRMVFGPPELFNQSAHAIDCANLTSVRADHATPSLDDELHDLHGVENSHRSGSTSRLSSGSQARITARRFGAAEEVMATPMPSEAARPRTLHRRAVSRNASRARAGSTRSIDSAGSAPAHRELVRSAVLAVRP